MKKYAEMSKEELTSELSALSSQYEEYKKLGLSLNMSRGKPGADQLEISLPLLDELNSSSDFRAQDGTDCRNYGLLDGIPSMKKLFSELFGVTTDEVMVGGNSSLNMMFDTIASFMASGVCGGEPWLTQGGIKFLCPVPGYDRHFGITQYFNIEMINIPMGESGPDMDMVESLVSADEKIKGIWCVPKYSNPTGITYSDETVRRFAALKPAAKDFRIMWDNAYAVHDVAEEGDVLLNLMEECKKNGTEDLPIMFTSTSKITFPGAGVAAMASSEHNMKYIKERYKYQTIGYDKLNQLRHQRYFGSCQGVVDYMRRHRDILEPKFSTVTGLLESEVKDSGVARWTNPRGGYFVSVDVADGTAKEVVRLCKEAGVVLTDAGATFPYGKDPHDSNIRIAPSYPDVAELEQAMKIFCVCVKLAAARALLA